MNSPPKRSVVRWALLTVVFVFAFSVGLYLWLPIRPAQAPILLQQAGAPHAARAPITATFTCAGGKSIVATFRVGTDTRAAAPGRPPSPSGDVELTLGGGEVLTLPRTISANGARYATADESVVFWNIGSTATLTQNGTATYADCVTKAK